MKKVLVSLTFLFAFCLTVLAQSPKPVYLQAYPDNVTTADLNSPAPLSMDLLQGFPGLVVYIFDKDTILGLAYEQEEREQKAKKSYNTLTVFAGPVVAGIKDNVNTIIGGRRQAITVGPGAAVGGYFRTNETAVVYAKGLASSIYDHEWSKTTFLQFSMGAVYMPKYFGVGAGLNTLLRPQANKGEFGINLMGMFKYPIANNLEFLAALDMGYGALNRSTHSLILGIGYIFPGK